MSVVSSYKTRETVCIQNPPHEVYKKKSLHQPRLLFQGQKIGHEMTKDIVCGLDNSCI